MVEEEVFDCVDFFLEDKNKTDSLTIDDIVNIFIDGYEENKEAVENELKNLVTFIVLNKFCCLSGH